MRARTSPRRLMPLAACCPRPTQYVPSFSLSPTTRRNISNPFKRKQTNDLTNPILDDYFKKKAQDGQGDKDAKPIGPVLRQGDISPMNEKLFDAKLNIPGWREDLPAAEQRKLLKDEQAREERVEQQRLHDLTAMTLDPNVGARQKLERELVRESIERRGRLTKAQKLMRTERSSTFKSLNLPTSVKKLQKVVNQIAGKTVSEALVQLRFSPKKVARDVIKGLEIAQNEAIVERGMGLGHGGSGVLERWERQRANMDMTTGWSDAWAYKRAEEDKAKATTSLPARARRGKPSIIRLKDGSKKVVKDPAEIYIDQAWVNKGESWKTPEFRARGRVNMLTHRTTSFSVLLKEEATRIRLSEEIAKKRDKRKLWVALPDRPVTSQRQYCLW